MKNFKHWLTTMAVLLCSITTSAVTYSDWTSTNKGQSNSTSSNTYNITASAGDVLTFEWLVSSESGYDKLIVTLSGSEILNKSGEQSGTYQHTFTSSGSYTMVVKYTKDGSVNNGSDYAKVYNIVKKSASIASGTCGSNLTWNLTNDGELTIEGTGEMTSTPWRDSYSSKIKSVTIGEGVTNIYNSAFYYCSNLTSVIIPESMTLIGDYAFYFCQNLTSINIPRDVTSIGRNAFFECIKLTIVTIPEDSKLTNLGEGAFDDCYELSSINIPKGVTSIGNLVFSYCSSLTSISIPEGVTSIGRSAFQFCNKLTTITIPDNVTSIGDYTFNSCRGLTSITIGSGVASIGEGAFNNCSSLTSMTCNAVTPPTIGGSYTFYNVNKSIPVYVPAKSINTYKKANFWQEFTNIQPMSNVVAWGTCGNDLIWTLSEEGELLIDGEGDMTDYGSESNWPWHNYRSSIKKLIISNGVTSIGRYAFSSCSNLSSVAIPETMVSIGNSAFYRCSKLNRIVIPNSVTSIGSNAFYGCYLYLVVNFSELKFTKGETSYGYVTYNTSTLIEGKDVERIDDCYFNTVDGVHTLVYYAGDEAEPSLPDNYKGENYNIGYRAFSGCTGLANITIPEGVTSIGSSAFYNCSSLVNISIPEGVTSIGSEAFSGCSCLTSINIPKNMTSIGNHVFSGCSSLTSIIIPESVTSIGYQAFYKCSNLANITLPESVSNIEEYAFSGTAWYNNQPEGVIYIGKVLYCYKGTMPQNTSIIVKDGTLGIAGYAFRECSDLKSITMPNSLINIGNSAFYECSGLTSITIPNSVTTIGSWAFAYTGISSIEIPNGVTSIGNGTFNKCSYLTNVKIPNSVKSIGSEAFNECCYLSSIEIPNSVTSIGDKAFLYCSRLTSVTIGDNVTSIGREAFKHCQSLTSVEIPNSVKSIGEYAFWYCYDLASVTIGDGLERIGYDAFKDCSELKQVHIGDIYAWCNIYFESSVSNPLWSAKYLYMNGEQVTDLVIPEDLTKIDNLYYIAGLTRITSLIPAEKLFAIGTNAFNSVKNSCILYVPYGAKDTYASTEGWSGFTDIIELDKPITDVTITINQYGSGTYCSEYALDFSEVAGLKAYAATGYNTRTGVVTLTRVMTAKAGEGLFIKGEPGDYIVPVMEDTDDNTLNMLVGTLTNTDLNGTSADGLYTNYKYTIKVGDAEPMFYQFADGSTLSAERAYLQIPTKWLPQTESKAIRLRFVSGETTEIEDIEPTGNSEQTTIIYDLMGRRVENPSKGCVYIVNGRKIVY